MALGAALACLGSMAGGYGVEIEAQWLQLVEQQVRLAGLPESLKGLRVGLLCDLHLGTSAEADAIAHAVDLLRAARPDVLLLGGDYIKNHGRQLRPCLDILGTLRPALGSYAVLGNHDRWHCDDATLRQAFADAGISLLVNAAVPLDGVHVVGLDTVWAGQPDPRRALATVPAAQPVLLLVHEPDFIDRIPAVPHSIVGLSGHTHGGQVIVPWRGPLCLPRYGRKYPMGLLPVHGQAGRQVYVSRGVGTSIVPLRLNCRPEVTLLTLQPRADDVGI